MDKGDIPFLSASALSRLIEVREVSPVEATEAYLERIDALNFKFNAYLTICRKEALQAARQAEQDISGGDYLGPMHGIPVAVKDQLWTQGIRTTSGSRFLVDFIPNEDATAVANLKRAGAVILGKTNMTEFAMVMASHRYGTPRNPWNLDMATGASSSGSAAATGSFLCATALGEDTGGSIRIPAAWCGLVGLNPSWGRVSRHGVMSGAWSIDAVAAAARTVEDAAITLGAIAGHDSKDPYSWNAPVPDYRRFLDGDITGLRVGVKTEEPSSELIDPEVRAAFAEATGVLSRLGVSLDEVSLPLTAHVNVLNLVVQGIETGLNHKARIRDQLQEFGRSNRVNLLTGSLIPVQAYYKVQKLRSLLRDQVHEALGTYDVLVFPTTGKTAQRIGDYQPITSKEQISAPSIFMTRMFNLSNCPSISVPCGFDSRGLPIGLMIGSRPGGEDRVLKVAHAYEQSTPWHTVKPPHA